MGPTDWAQAIQDSDQVHDSLTTAITHRTTTPTTQPATPTTSWQGIHAVPLAPVRAAPPLRTLGQAPATVTVIQWMLIVNDIHTSFTYGKLV